MSGSGGSYSVPGGHTCAAKNSYTPTITARDQDGNTRQFSGSGSIQ